MVHLIHRKRPLFFINSIDFYAMKEIIGGREYGHEAYQIDGDDEQNRMQVKFSS